MPQRPIAAVLAAHTPELMKLPGVSGTGEGARQGHAVIVIYVARRTRELDARLPRALEGWPVELREVGEVRALGDSSR